MEEAFQRARTQHQRIPGKRQRHLLEKMAQPREVVIIRSSILVILAIAFALSVSVSNKSESSEKQKISFWDITSYKYCFVTIVIGIAYNIVALLLNLLQYYVPDIKVKILFEFEFLCDKITACLVATGAAAGLGASVDLQKASAYREASSVLNIGKAVCSILVVAFMLAFVLSLCSSRAFEERGSNSNNWSANPQEDHRNPFSQTS